MEYIKFGAEIVIYGVALFIAIGVTVSLIGGAIGFVLWTWDKLKEEKSQWKNWEK